LKFEKPGSSEYNKQTAKFSPEQVVQLPFPRQVTHINQIEYWLGDRLRQHRDIIEILEYSRQKPLLTLEDSENKATEDTLKRHLEAFRYVLGELNWLDNIASRIEHGIPVPPDELVNALQTADRIKANTYHFVGIDTKSFERVLGRNEAP
jgi:hypothetical protein